MSDARPFTDAQFKRMRDQHLPYELLMLRAAAAVLGEPEPAVEEEDAVRRRWMAIECFFIHLRNLDSFFYETGAKQMDALAIHFFEEADEWRASGRRPKRSPEMKDAVELAGTMVAHLSYDRQTNVEAGKKLKWLRLAQEMDGVYRSFQGALSGTERHVPLEKAFTLLPTGDFRSILGPGSVTTISTLGDLSRYLEAISKKRKGREE